MSGYFFLFLGAEGTGSSSSKSSMNEGDSSVLTTVVANSTNRRIHWISGVNGSFPLNCFMSM